MQSGGSGGSFQKIGILDGDGLHPCVVRAHYDKFTAVHGEAGKLLATFRKGMQDRVSPASTFAEAFGYTPDDRNSPKKMWFFTQRRTTRALARARVHVGLRLRHVGLQNIFNSIMLQ